MEIHLKLVFSSAGFTTPDIVAAAAVLAGKEPGEMAIAVLNEAHAGEIGDKRWMITELSRLAEVFGGPIDVVSPWSIPEREWLDRIISADLLYVVGGHSDHLMYAMRETGFQDRLPEILEATVYVGSSAGSMVLGHRGTDELCRAMYGEEPRSGITHYVELFEASLLPHLGSDQFPAIRENTVLGASGAEDCPLIALRDDQAIVITTDRIEPVGGDPLVALRGVRQRLDDGWLSNNQRR